MSKPKTLITGVSGFVGTKLAEKLLSQNHEVMGADLCICESMEGREGYQFQKLDLTNWESVNALDLLKFDYIVHLAAAGSKLAGRSWPLCTRVNVEGTANLVRKLLREAKQLNGLTVEGNEDSHQQKPLSPISHLPSSREKRTAPLLLYTKTWYEDHLDTCPAFAESSYVVTKHATSLWIKTMASVYPAPVVIAKVFQVYGPGDDPNNVLSYAARCLKNNEPATFGSGTQLRDWIYIDDFIDGLVACLSCAQSGHTQYDLGTGETYTLRNMIEQLAERSRSSLQTSTQTITTSTIQLTFDPAKDRGDIQITDHANNQPPCWKPKFTTEMGLAKLFSSIS
jgi:nucleoside-diphosphate-sugar epimerase